MITIRRAKKEDCPQILELVKELAAYEKAPNEVTVSLEHFIESGFGQNPVWWAFVGLIPGPSPALPEGEEKREGKIVGVALYYIRFSTWKGQRMYLEDIIVTRSMRGKGIGKMLFDKLIQEARDKNLNGMVWQVLEWNETAINFYKKYKASFDPEWVNVSIEL